MARYLINSRSGRELIVPDKCIDGITFSYEQGKEYSLDVPDGHTYKWADGFLGFTDRLSDEESIDRYDVMSLDVYNITCCKEDPAVPAKKNGKYIGLIGPSGMLEKNSRLIAYPFVDSSTGKSKLMFIPTVPQINSFIDNLNNYLSDSKYKTVEYHDKLSDRNVTSYIFDCLPGFPIDFSYVFTSGSRQERISDQCFVTAITSNGPISLISYGIKLELEGDRFVVKPKPYGAIDNVTGLKKPCILPIVRID